MGWIDDSELIIFVDVKCMVTLTVSATETYKIPRRIGTICELPIFRFFGSNLISNLCQYDG